VLALQPSSGLEDFPQILSPPLTGIQQEDNYTFIATLRKEGGYEGGCKGIGYRVGAGSITDK